MRSSGGGDDLGLKSIEGKNPLAQESRDFLDDFALVASGPGGPDNVSGACMEISERDDHILVLRVARNAGLRDEMLCRLRGIIQNVTENITRGMGDDQRREELLVEIIKRSRSRLVKHTKVLERMFRFVCGNSPNQFNTPQYAFPRNRAESSHDTELLGNYCEETHGCYMLTCQHRLKQLKELVLRISFPTVALDMHSLASLTKLAYQVRRSCSFKQLVEYNISKSEEPGGVVPKLGDIVQRLGQISKFYRAAVTLTTFIAKLLRVGKRIEIKAISTEKIKISELACRTAAQVRCRGGYRFTSSGGAQIHNMINRWPTYREHVELQLIIFYEQNPGLTLFSPYIGCSKQSCYLCYNFIVEHGQFQVDGCHQSLYSLWTIRETISFADEERAHVFKRALTKLCLDLEQKVEAQKVPHWRRPGFSSHNESVANLSRVSLALDPFILEPCFEKHEDNPAAIQALEDARAIPTKISFPESSVATLRPIPEGSPEGPTEARTNHKSLKHVISLDEIVDIARGDSYSQVGRDVIAPPSSSQNELAALSASTQVDSPDPVQGLPSVLVASPLFAAPAIAGSEETSKRSQEPRVPDRPRRRHRHHHNRSRQGCHIWPLPHGSRTSRRSSKDDHPTLYQAATKKGKERRTKTPKESESSSSRPRVMHGRRRRARISLKHRLFGIVKVVLAAFVGVKRQGTRRSW